MNKESALVTLLTKLFATQDSLKRFVYSLPTQDTSISRALDASTTKLMALSFVDELRRRGLVDNRFFTHLIEEQPEYADLIRNVQDQWLVESEEWSRLPISEPSTFGRADAPTVFVSYARNDIAFFEELSTHLSLLQRKGLIQFWQEGRLRAGEAWKDVISSQIQIADIVILLVSADLLASDFIWDHEFKLVYERQRQGKTTVIPVIVKPCLWQDSPLAEFQAFPSDGKPVSLSPNPDRTWVTLVRQIEQVVRNIQGAK